MNISVFGLGYVGCVTMACLARNGHSVTGIDKNQHKIDLVNQGKPTIVEKDIDVLFREAADSELISASKDYITAVVNSDLSILSVGTPSMAEGHPNLEFIFRVAEEIGEALTHKNDFHIVVIRSTVPPGTNKNIGRIIENRSGKTRNKDFAVVSNPEFLREGSAVSDYLDPPVTVIGSDNQKAAETVAQLYAGLTAPVRFTGIETAEMIKYVSNAWHALKITFANETGNICKKLGIDSHEVMDLFLADHKLNLSGYYLKPGFAYGGSCLPKDLKGLQMMAHDVYVQTPVLENIEISNRNQRQIAIRMVESRGKRRIGLLGLSFKPGTDDLRYSPMVDMAEYLLGKGYQLKIYDKNVNLSKLTGTNKDYIESHIPHLSGRITGELIEVIEKSEVIIIAHNIPDAENIISENREKYFIDLVRVTNHKFENYEGICW